MQKKNKKILLVEDEILIAKAQKAALEKQGYLVVTVENGEDALELFKKTSDIDLVLMDLDLGEGWDGTETAEALLKYRAVPIVFLSSHTECELITKIENSMSYGYVVKNSKIEVLDISIKMAFKLFESNKKLKHSEESLSITLQSIGEAVIATDNNGLITRMNPAAERLTGWTFQQAEHKNLPDVLNIIDENTGLPEINPVKRAFESSENKTHEDHSILLSRDGMEYLIAENVSPIRDAQGNIRGVILVFSDVTEKSKAVRQLKGSFADLRHSQNIAHINSWKYDLVLREFTITEEGLVIFGYPPDSHPAFEDILSCVNDSDRHKVLEIFNTTAQAGQFFSFDLQIRKKDSFESGIIAVNIEVQFDDAQNPRILIGTFQDITERKQVENKLRESEERYRRITAGLNDYLYTVKVKDGKPFETIHNEACFAITGYRIEDFANDPYLWINMVVPEEREMVAGRFQKILEGKDLPAFEHRITCKDGTVRWISDTSIPKYDSDGLLVSYDGVIKDISERKQAEEKIKSLLLEKELILREVHHRIKNNMNTINSLLNLQAGTLKEPAAVLALEDAGRRVRSMMMLYDKLYRSEFFDKMSVVQYLPTLIDEILINFPNARSVQVLKNIDDFSMDIKKLQSLGIIINELLTNIMKYAFVGKKTGQIYISASLAGKAVTILVGDNGNGMPESVDFEHSTGFGLMLVGVLTKQLKGRLRIERGDGTRIFIEFDI